MVETAWHRADGYNPPPGSPLLGSDFPWEWREQVDDLFCLWRGKLARNRLRRRYYYSHNRIKDLGISIPPPLRGMDSAVNWPQKAVDALAVRSRFDGFFASDAEMQDRLDGIVRKSHLRTKYRQAVQSTLIHSCSFATVNLNTGGQAVIDIYSAEDAAARWDKRKGRIAYGMTVENYDRSGAPTEIVLYNDEARVSMRCDEAGLWSWEAEFHKMGRPTMDAFVYRQTIDRPFGQSRISRAVMTTTDCAVREVVRGEVSSEFAAAPQKYLLGGDDSIFGDRPAWEAYIGSIMSIGPDENGDVPQFGQLPQASLEQHASYMRQLAAKFSAETNIPVSQLGVIHDNPTSAEAISAATEPLVIEAEDFNDGARETLNTLATMAIAAESGMSYDEALDEGAELTAIFKVASMPSVVSETDAMVKLASVVPGFAGTSTFFEQVGFSEDTRKRVMAEMARANAVSAIQALDAAQVEAS